MYNFLDLFCFGSIGFALGYFVKAFMEYIEDEDL